MNLLTCFNSDLYRDVLCKIGNGMHNDHRYSQLSPAMRTEAKITFHTADCCLLTRTLTRGPDGECSFNVEATFGLGLSLFEK